MNTINGIMKSHETLYVDMVTMLYSDMISALVTEKEVRKDLETIRNRVNREGISFLTKTLPQLGKAVDRALSTDSALNVSSFRMVRGSRLPQFMRRLFESLFSFDGYPLQDAASENQKSGEIHPCRETPSVARQTDALRAIRQVCYLFYKLQTPYSSTQENEVINSFVNTEVEVWDGLCQSHDDTEIERIARSLCHRVLNMGDPFSGLPKHGPGSVATGERQAEKHVFARWYDLLMEVFPYEQWFSVNSRAICDSYHRFEGFESNETGTAKVVLVPKDSRGPRLISCEPLEYQWIQQSIKDVMMTTIESHPLTSGHVNFTRQDINRDLALLGSATGKWATLDMKEASDRVSVHHVAGLFPDRWCEALFASRTTHTKLPDGRLVHLKKMAPMGSAVCFPVESIVFWSLSVAALIHTCGLSRAQALESVYVYGDDIIVRSDHHAAVISALERFGLKTNPQKCCTHGFFRESCGMDAFRGNPVTPIRCHQQWSNRLSPEALASWVALSNNLWEAGCWSCAQYIESLIQTQMGYLIPTTHEVIGCISFVRPDLPAAVPKRLKKRKNNSLQRTEIYGFCLKSSSEMTRTEGYPLLLRLLVEGERRKSQEERSFKSYPSSWLSQPSAGTSTGKYPIAHRNKLSRAWTPCRINRRGVIER